MSNVETLGVLERRISAFIPQQQIRGEVETRLKNIGRTAKVHGFRPGKVPFSVLRQQYGAQVQQEVMGDALQRSFVEAAQANNLQVVGYPNFELKSNDPAAEQIEFSATFEVYPTVVVGDLAGVTVENATFTVGEAELENTLLTLRKQRTEYVAVERAAQKEDQVVIDFQGLLNGAPFEGGEAKDFPTVPGSGRMLADFETAIVGMKQGESKSFDMTFPADYHGKHLAGQQVNFTITVKSVSGPRVPELDAEFAKTFGVPNGDIEKLKADINENLVREVQRRLSARNKEAAMAALLQVTDFEVPKFMLQNEARRLMQQSLRDMEERGVKLPKGMELPLDSFMERATRRVKLGLILSELVEKNDLKAKPEQVHALIAEYAKSFEDPDAVVRWHKADPSRLEEVEGLAVEENVVAWVMAHAQAKSVAVSFNELMGNA